MRGRNDGSEPKAVLDRCRRTGRCGHHDGAECLRPGGSEWWISGWRRSGGKTAWLWPGGATRHVTRTPRQRSRPSRRPTPNVTLNGQPGEFGSYWDKLATQTAGGQAPDIIQMDMAYISEYGNRGALLDLGKNGADTSKFIEGTVDSGKINDQLVGVNAGINSAVIVANPKIFEKAKMDLPDDKTWTWDQLSEVAAEVASKAGVPFGVVGNLFGADPMFGAYLRQNGKELFTRERLWGLSQPTLRPGST